MSHINLTALSRRLKSTHALLRVAEEQSVRLEGAPVARPVARPDQRRS